MPEAGKLYLIPVPITVAGDNAHIPEFNLNVVKGLNKFIAENAKTARSFLKGFSYTNISTAEIVELNKHTSKDDLPGLIKWLLDGHDVGLLSDAGCPAIADPGAEVVKLAHKNSIQVVPLTGPSSIVLGIMASGFNGQNFAFVGYLPVDKQQKVLRIKELERIAYRQGQAQFFIETPYRNVALFESLLENLLPQTNLFIGINLSSINQLVKTKPVAYWKKSEAPDFNKIPAVFGIYK